MYQSGRVPSLSCEDCEGGIGLVRPPGVPKLMINGASTKFLGYYSCLYVKKVKTSENVKIKSVCRIVLYSHV